MADTKECKEGDTKGGVKIGTGGDFPVVSMTTGLGTADSGSQAGSSGFTTWVTVTKQPRSI